jgi:hypothetical protein
MDPENTFLWLEDRAHYIKRYVSLAEFVALVAEQIKRDADEHASNKGSVKQAASSSMKK